MALTVRNNRSAMSALGQLKKNDTALAKQLKKVASGMKVNGAGDDASGYAISERMRAQIRGLGQDLQNAQNGRSLLRTAEGAVDSTVSILRTMKAKAIDAANDTNTDADRATIQKEIEQAIDQIDDNALVTYNGKYLLTGDWKKSSFSALEQTIINAMDTEWVHNAISLVRETYGFAFGDASSTCNELHVEFRNEPKSNEPVWLETTEDGNGDTESMTLFINTDYYQNMLLADVDGDPQRKDGTVGRKLDRALTEGIAQAALAANWSQVIIGWTAGNTSARPAHYSDAIAWQTKGLAALVTGIDDEEKNRIQRLADEMYGDGETSNNRLMPMKNLLFGKFDGEDARALGYFMYRFKMYIEGTSSDQVPFFPNDIGCTLQDYSDAKHAWARDQISSGDDILRLSKIDLSNNDTGALTGSDAGYGPTKTAETILSETITADRWDEPESASSLIDGLTVYWPQRPERDGLKIQTGTRANQNLTVFLSDMRARALGVATSDGRGVSVATREKATAAIGIVDVALERALDMQTTIGAYQEELLYTEANLVTASENVQASESQIRDADMAKAMTDYTKTNILAQSAQAMLAQANQNGSNVLSLLQ